VWFAHPSTHSESNRSPMPAAGRLRTSLSLNRHGRRRGAPSRGNPILSDQIETHEVSIRDSNLTLPEVRCHKCQGGVLRRVVADLSVNLNEYLARANMLIHERLYDLQPEPEFVCSYNPVVCRSPNEGKALLHEFVNAAGFIARFCASWLFNRRTAS
jgi:hypothetical protein